MRRLRVSAAFAATLALGAILSVAAAQAAPTEVNVRIEGKSETLFEGPIVTDGHRVRASSETEAPPAGNRCNGKNLKANPQPGPTPTASSVDAMRIAGQGFDGLWYPKFDDYFIKAWGPDHEDVGQGEYWGILVNNAYASVGGCQYLLDGGDEVFWAYDAFRQRPQLALFPAGYDGGSRTLTATAALNQPFEVEVVAWEGYNESTPPAHPARTGSKPFKEAEVAPVIAGPGGFEKVDTGSSEMVKTGEDGLAEVEFSTYGWHRIKATRFGAGGVESAIRSNRLDVCVPQPPAADCGALPADDVVRTPPARSAADLDEEEELEQQLEQKEQEEKEEEEERERKEQEEREREEAENSPPDGVPGAKPPAGTGPAGSSGPAGVDERPVRLQRPSLDRHRVARGIVGVSWRVLDPGVGVAGWTVSSKTLGRKGSEFVTRARGTARSVATLRLPVGAAYRIRFEIVDVLGCASDVEIGSVRIPRPDS